MAEVDPCPPCDQAINRNIEVFSIRPYRYHSQDLLLFLANVKHKIEAILTRALARHGSVKWYACSKINFVKNQFTPEAKISIYPYFRSDCQILLNVDQVEQQTIIAYQKIIKSYQEFVQNGSNWSLENIIKLNIHVGRYRPVYGSSYIPLPKKLTARKAIINIQNTDNLCFLYSVLCGLHPHIKNKTRASSYTKYLNSLNLRGLTFPMNISQIEKFEHQNKVSINVFSFMTEVFPVHITIHKNYPHHVNLLLISKGSKKHYCYIRKLSTLFCRRVGSKRKQLVCNYCLYATSSPVVFAKHERFCSTNSPQKVVPPSEDNKILQFTALAKQLAVPYVIYSDLEALCLQVQGCENPPSSSYASVIKETHEPCGFCYQVVSTTKGGTKPPVLYRGENAIDQFLDCLEKEELKIRMQLQKIIPIKMTEKDWEASRSATICHICKKAFSANCDIGAYI